jgi:hypothetical protein
MSRWTDPRFPDMVHHADPRDRAAARRANELYQPLDPGGGAARSVDPAYATQVKFGNTVTMNASNGSERQRLLSADLARLEQKEQWHSGSWILTIQSRYVSAPTSFIEPCLATAEISMGAGGASIVFEVSAWPGFTLAIPTSYCDVTMKWDPLITLPSGNRSPQNINVQVTGLLQRGVTSRSARRVIYMPQNAAAQAAAGDFWISGSLASGQVTGRIPAFARSVRPIGDSESDAMLDPNPATVFLALEPPAFGVDISGAALKQLMLTGESLPIPGGAGEYLLAMTAGGSGVPGLDFEIAL